ncbi:MAG: TetR/AcrR family transcriptional regulator [Flavobacteriales bacterium]|nr:TetR/AcrR family transcriptional regulator [Flavobacteriales bacterium]
MASKSEITANYIVRTVAPIFNKKGYVGTSLSDLTSATGLTKGAIYGNFKNKEELSLEAFNHNIRFVLGMIRERMDAETTSIGKLKALNNFYRDYTKETIHLGGCPILNVGIDANHLHPLLLTRVDYVIQKLEESIAEVIQNGIAKQEIKQEIEPIKYARLFFSKLEGAIFMAVIRKNEAYLKEMTDHIDYTIDKELKV